MVRAAGRSRLLGALLTVTWVEPDRPLVKVATRGDPVPDLEWQDLAQEYGMGEAGFEAAPDARRVANDLFREPGRIWNFDSDGEATALMRSWVSRHGGKLYGRVDPVWYDEAGRRLPGATAAIKRYKQLHPWWAKT